MGDITLHEDPAPLGHLQATAERARDYIAKSKAPNTKKAYRADWQHFDQWCTTQDLVPMPAAPETIALYLADLAETYKVSTITRRLATISQAHQEAKFETPTQSALVRTIMKGIRREKGVAQAGKAPAVTEVIRAMVEQLPPTIWGARDRALLLLGFAGAFRRGELAALTMDDVAFTNDGLVVTMRRSKTDQEGQGAKKGIPYGSHPQTCPVRALRAWLELAGITSGPLFRPINRWKTVKPVRISDYAVALIVKRAAVAAGYDPAAFAGHSLRAGLATAAAARGVSERAIMQQTGHRSTMMLRKYIREGSLFRENAAANVGL